MKPQYRLPLVFVIAVGLIFFVSPQFRSKFFSPEATPAPSPISTETQAISLPSPQKSKGMSVEQALLNRRSRRSFTDEPLTLNHVSQLLWSAQGVTAAWGGRTAPSAKSTYPLEVYLFVKTVDKLSPAVYHYLPQDHQLALWLEPLPLDTFMQSTYHQPTLEQAPAILIITADLARAADQLTAYQESGHASQNVYLQTESLKLATVAITNFNASQLKAILKLPDTQTVVYLMPLGHPKEE